MNTFFSETYINSSINEYLNANNGTGGKQDEKHRTGALQVLRKLRSKEWKDERRGQSYASKNLQRLRGLVVKMEKKDYVQIKDKPHLLITIGQLREIVEKNKEAEHTEVIRIEIARYEKRVFHSYANMIWCN